VREKKQKQLLTREKRESLPVLAISRPENKHGETLEKKKKDGKGFNLTVKKAQTEIPL